MSVARQEATINQRFSLRSKLDRCIHHWECPGCHCCRDCSATARVGVTVLVLKVILAITAIVLAIVLSVNSGGDDSDYADTSFSTNDTRLVVISSFFAEQAEITVDTGDHFSANATLYLVNQQPPLTAKFHVSRSTIVHEWLPDQFPWHYYLHPNSNVTIKACLRRPCDPFYFFIIKGPQNFKNWKKSSPNVENAGEKRALITKYCSDGMQQVNYTTKEDDHYYLFTYTDSICWNENYVDDSGTASLLIEKSEYSVSDIKADGVCSTYELPSCSLSVPLRAGYEKALIAVQGQNDETYSISFSSSNRVWAYCVVIIPPVILLVISGIFTIGCICYKLRRRRNYSPL